MDTSAPIGIFDSGIGGLTVAKAIHQLLPKENLLYFGDTYHAPWGDKSKTVIEHYAITICDFFLQEHCKVIVIACNTASAIAYNAIHQHIGQRAKLVNVIDPTVEYIAQTLPNQHIGLIGTKQTVASSSYPSKISTLSPDIIVNSLATPLLVPLIEEGFINKLPCQLIIEEYLSNPILTDISALILACTHYPLLKTQITEFYKTLKYQPVLIDAAELTAVYLQELLKTYNLFNNNIINGQKNFFISDYNPHFIKIAEIFFADHQLRHYNLWDR